MVARISSSSLFNPTWTLPLIIPIVAGIAPWEETNES